MSFFLSLLFFFSNGQKSIHFFLLFLFSFSSFPSPASSFLPFNNGEAPSRSHHVPQAGLSLCPFLSKFLFLIFLTFFAIFFSLQSFNPFFLFQPGVGRVILFTFLNKKSSNFSKFLSFLTAIGRLCEKCDGKCVICDSYVRPCTLVRVCDECNYGSYQGRCVICGGQGISDAYYCKECTQMEKDVSVFIFSTTLGEISFWLNQSLFYLYVCFSMCVCCRETDVRRSSTWAAPRSTCTTTRKNSGYRTNKTATTTWLSGHKKGRNKGTHMHCADWSCGVVFFS